ncbi:MAG: threonine/serine exporter family protein [Clostridiales bacterium]|nr:threonine/serine exporter family protein [Clostridiales bacterium]
MDARKYPIGEIIDIACRAGKIVLENGGETYRVEDTMLYFCKAFGIENCESYSTPTTIIISIIDNYGESFTRMMRIPSRGTNIDKVEAVNDLSREINKNPITIVEAKKKLQEINQKQPYSLWLTVLAAGLASASFTVIFGGGWIHFLMGLVVGASLQLVVGALNKVQLGYFTTNFMGGAVAALLGWLLSYFGILSDWWIVTFASLMLLVPGILFTNALRDAVAGELVSGISRGIEALGIAVALASGAAIAIMLLSQIGGL